MNIVKALCTEKRKSARVQAKLDRLINTYEVQTINVRKPSVEGDSVEGDVDNSTPKNGEDRVAMDDEDFIEELADPVTGIMAKLMEVFGSEKNEKKKAKDR